jgi:hypothetical protein
MQRYCEHGGVAICLPVKTACTCNHLCKMLKHQQRGQASSLHLLTLFSHAAAGRVDAR